MVLGMLFENFKNYYILRYVIYEFLKKVLGGPQPTCLVRVHCAGCGIMARAVSQCREERSSARASSVVQCTGGEHQVTVMGLRVILR